MAEIVDDNGNVRWYVELKCPNGHEVRPEGREVRSRDGSIAFTVRGLERPCPLCPREFGAVSEIAKRQKDATVAMEADGWSIIGTGGGCEAWYKRIGETSYLVTLEDDPSLPIVGEPATLAFFENPDAQDEEAWATRVGTFNGPASLRAAEAALKAAQVDAPIRRCPACRGELVDGIAHDHTEDSPEIPDWTSERPRGDY